MTSPRLLSLAALTLLLAACSDTGTEPARTAPPLDMRTGYMIGRYGGPERITFEVRDGRAFFQGDIDLGPADQVPTTPEQLQPSGTDANLNSVVNGMSFRWPYDSTLQAIRVPYLISAGLPDKDRATNAMNHIMARVPAIRFVAKTNADNDFVRFLPVTDGNCSSPIGRVGGAQDVKLDRICHMGLVIHELGHALGLFHEMARCDRDIYITIHVDNIIPERVGEFASSCGSAAGSKGSDVFSYDEGSIMHYGTHAFSANGLPTISSNRGLDWKMGNVSGLSPTDIATLRKVYTPGRRRPS